MKLRHQERTAPFGTCPCGKVLWTKTAAKYHKCPKWHHATTKPAPLA